MQVSTLHMQVSHYIWHWNAQIDGTIMLNMAMTRSTHSEANSFGRTVSIPMETQLVETKRLCHQVQIVNGGRMENPNLNSKLHLHSTPSHAYKHLCRCQQYKDGCHNVNHVPLIHNASTQREAYFAYASSRKIHSHRA